MWSDDLPPEDVIACEKIDVALPGVNVGGEGEPVKSVIGSSEDYVPSVSLALIEFLKLSDGAQCKVHACSCLKSAWILL